MARQRRVNVAPIVGKKLLSTKKVVSSAHPVGQVNADKYDNNLRRDSNMLVIFSH